LRQNSYISSITYSNNNEDFIADPAANGALSRWIESDSMRLRIMSYPSEFEADHTCYKGHSLYILSGKIELQIGKEITKWKKGDALIIPDTVPHVVKNTSKEEAKVIVVDYN